MSLVYTLTFYSMFIVGKAQCCKSKSLGFERHGEQQTLSAMIDAS